MVHRNLPQISMGSMADIAFLLLIFFLVATTMETDVGIMRKLTSLDGEPKEAKVHDRDIMVVLVNRDNRLLVEGEEIALSHLQDKAYDFIKNEKERSDFPKVKRVYFKSFGEIWITPSHVISLQNDRGTSYEMYIAVQNELVAAYNRLRNEAAMRKWGKPFDKLDVSKQNIIEDIYKLRISEAEPN